MTQLCRGLAEEIFGQKHLRVRKFFAEAITRNGRQSYAQELSLACRRRYLVNGAADQVLAGVAELAAQQGHNLDLYYSCMAPEQLEMVIIPGLSVALVDCACPELEARYEDVLLNLRPEGEAVLRNILKAFWRIRSWQRKRMRRSKSGCIIWIMPCWNWIMNTVCMMSWKATILPLWILRRWTLFARIFSAKSGSWRRNGAELRRCFSN